MAPVWLSASRPTSPPARPHNRPRGKPPFDRTPYDPAHYDAKTIRRNLLLYDDGICGTGVVYERKLFLSALDKMAGHVRLGEDFSLRLFAVQGVRITRYDRLTVWYEYGGGVSTDAAARERMLGDWRAMLEVLRAAYPHDRTVRLAYAYYFNDRRKSRLVRGLVGRLIVPQNCAFKKAQREWQPPTNGDAAKLRAVYEFAERRLPPNDAAFTKIGGCRLRLAARHRCCAAAHRGGSGGAVHAAGPWVRLHEPVSQP